jgi:hypothetical protein
MSRVYAKVSIEMWGDKKFCELSPLPPSGQSLWMYLLTGEFRTSIPGLNLKVGIGALSDRLHWKVNHVEKHWAEIESKGMAIADWRHGVVWLPKGIEHNEPESPNVIRGWGKVVLPQSEVITEAIASLEAYIAQRLSRPYAKAFHEAFREVFRDPSPNQEQEQEQDPYPQTPAARGPKVSTRKPTVAEEKRANDYLRTTGRCPHTPPCDSHDECVGKLVYLWRHNALAGMLEEATS